MSKNNKYGIDLKEYKHHQKKFPWMFLVKILLWVGLIFFAYYMTKELSLKQESKKEEFDIEIDSSYLNKPPEE